MNDRRKPGLEPGDGTRVVVEGTEVIHSIPQGYHETKWIVGPACKSENGRWVCVTHLQSWMPYQADKDDHLRKFAQSPSRCILAWYCRPHDRLETVKVGRRRKGGVD